MPINAPKAPTVARRVNPPENPFKPKPKGSKPEVFAPGSIPITTVSKIMMPQASPSCIRGQAIRRAISFWDWSCRPIESARALRASTIRPVVSPASSMGETRGGNRPGQALKASVNDSPDAIWSAKCIEKIWTADPLNRPSFRQVCSKEKPASWYCLA